VSLFRLGTGLKAGQAAPDFRLKDAQGKEHQLADYKGRWLVLFFYPADFTSGCTIESCGFRDRYQDFQKAGAEVLGVSGDTESTHAAFAAEHKLPYLLLSDPKRLAREAYGVPHVLGRLSGRVTCVIDPQGILRLVFDSREDAIGHVQKALELFAPRGAA
jgi:peroxiredoxin Q/BCP